MQKRRVLRPGGFKGVAQSRAPSHWRRWRFREGNGGGLSSDWINLHVALRSGHGLAAGYLSKPRKNPRANLLTFANSLAPRTLPRSWPCRWLANHNIQLYGSRCNLCYPSTTLGYEPQHAATLCTNTALVDSRGQCDTLRLNTSGTGPLS